MKAVVILCCFFAFYQVEARIISNIIEDGAKPDFEPEEEECIIELNLDRDEMKVLTKNDIIPENNHKVQQLAGCNFQKHGFIDSNGVINYEKLTTEVENLMKDKLADQSPRIRKIVLEILTGAITHCQNKSLHGNTPGETAVKIHNCIMKKLNEHTE